MATHRDVSKVAAMVPPSKMIFQNKYTQSKNMGSLWDTPLVGDMSLMFWNAYSAGPDMSTWDVGEITAMQNMFVDVTLPITTYDNNALINFAGQTVLIKAR